MTTWCQMKMRFVTTAVCHYGVWVSISTCEALIVAQCKISVRTVQVDARHVLGTLLNTAGAWLTPKDGVLLSQLEGDEAGTVDKPTILYFHGGAYITCSVNTHIRLISALAHTSEVRGRVCHR